MNKLAIVTVCYNAAELIEKTIESVLSQTSQDYEYYFFDGASKDNTVEKIKETAGRFPEASERIHITSEPDKGIYDAMNKAIDRVECEWMLFLNAGDMLADRDVLSKVIPELKEDVDFVYGNTVYRDTVRERDYRMDGGPIEGLRTDGMVFCHQSVFNRTECLRKLHYSPDYRYAADYDCYLRALCSGAKFRQLQVYISIYLGGGASDENMAAVKREYCRSQKECSANEDPEKYYRKNMNRYRLVQTAYKVLPKAAVRWLKRNKEYRPD